MECSERPDTQRGVRVRYCWVARHITLIAALLLIQLRLVHYGPMNYGPELQTW